MRGLSKKQLIVRIVGFVLIIVVLWSILIIIISGTGKDSDHLSKKNSDKAETEKVIPDSEEEKENQKFDEQEAEVFRHAAEVATAEIVVYDEAVAAFGDNDSDVAVFSIGAGGIKWEKDYPELAAFFQEIFMISSDGIKWSSEKYKGKRYTVYYHRSVEGASTYPVLTVVGRWEDEE